MHLGLVIYGDLQIRTGGFLYDRKIVEALRAQGHRVSIFAFPWRTPPRNWVDNLTHALPRWLAELHPDLLIQDELVHPSLFFLNRRLRQSFRGPIFTLVHHLRSSESNASPFAGLSRQIESAYLKTIDGMVCNSQATYSSVQALTGRSYPHVIAYPGKNHLQPKLSPDAVRQRATHPGPIRLLFVGSVIPRKGLHLLVDALQEIDHRTWHVDLVGDETINRSYTASLKRKIRRANFTRQITWHGALSETELDRLWQQSQVLVVPSEYEGFGIVYLEAMAYGLVPIGSSAGGARELIEEGRQGFLIDPGDRSTLRARLRYLIENRGAVSAIGMAAMERYARHPTWEDSTAEIQSFLIEHMQTYPML